MVSINAELARATQEAGASTALLVTTGGTCIAGAGDLKYVNTAAMAALVAAMFAATREVARLVGENRFSILLQQGERRNLHVSLIADTAMMVVVFEDYERIGRVRMAARRASAAIAAALSRRPHGLPQSFCENALGLVDRVFEP